MIWLTEIDTIDPLTLKNIVKVGPQIEADSEPEAIDKANLMECRLVGKYVLEINEDDIFWSCLN